MDDYTAKAKVMVKVLDFVKYGGAGGDRTLYLFNAIEALSRVSYSPTAGIHDSKGHNWAASPTTFAVGRNSTPNGGGT